MGIRAQSVTRDGIRIEMGDGRTFEVTRQQVRANFQQETGTAAQRRTKTILWLRNSAIAALGAEQFNPRQFAVDFDNADGGFTSFGTSDEE